MAAGDYELAEQLHDGRTSQVFRGFRRRDGARAILKALRREFSDGPGVARLQREAELLRRCAGPAVPEVLALERWDGCPVLVLRDIGGASLHRFRQGRALSLVARLDLALEICGALARVHAAGVVHRDLKPANIIVHGDGERVQLIDFAAAAAGEGTLQYMSPEQTGRTGRDVDPRSDYYALGVTLYELFTGRLPFASDDPLELVHAHLARVPAAPVALAPDLGDTLSGVILHLLEKSPEARYQSLEGLRHDLARCRDAFARGELPRFEPAARDRPPGLQLPATLFDRERELAALLSLWTAVRAGARGLALVAGPSGAGKSALLRAFAGAVREAGGVFVSGRFEQVEKATPYAGLLAALDQLLRRALAEPDERLAAVRAALEAALGEGAAGLADVLPALALVIGARPRPTVAVPAEAAGRFHAAVTRLVRVFAGPHAPLVIAVDDLQWADAASLRLYDELAREPDLDHLLLVGSYRDDELAAAHPLRSLAADVRVRLGPLAPAEVQRLIGDTLAWPEGQAAELAAVVAATTDNNPLFVRAYLRWLFDQGLLVWSPERDGWAWDAAATARAAPDADIVALMTRRLAALGPDVRGALQAAACVGARFDAGRLAGLLGREPADVTAALTQAIERGLVLAVDVDVYEFVHDRVQQAAYAGLAADERQRLHLELGRGLLRGATSAVLEDMLFEIVGHLNLAAERIEDPAERLRLAELDLAAGRKAMRAAAFTTAVQLLRQGLALLPEHAWETRYDLAFALARDCMECEHFAGDPDAAAARFAPLLARARDDVDRAGVHDLKVALETDRGHIHAALAAGRAGLALLGVHVPANASRLAILRELAAIRWLRGRTSLRDLAALPAVRDPRIGCALRLLCTICVSAYHHQPDLALLYGLRALALALRHGVNGESAIAVALYAFGHVHMFDDAAGARALHAVAYALADRFPDPRLGPQLANYCGVYVASWLDPVAIIVPRLERELQHASRIGASSMALYISAGVMHARWLGVGDIDQLLASARAHAPIGVGMPGFDQRHWHLLFERMALALRGETDGPTTLEGPDFDEDALVDELGPHSRALASAYHLIKLALLYHHGAIDQALVLSKRLRWARAEGTLLLVDQITLPLLVLTARGQPLARKARQRAQAWLGHLRRWAALCPANIEGRLFLVEAELARCRGDHDQAALLYPRAVEAARRAGHLRIEALALERAGRHARARESHVLSHMYLGAAAATYDRWGAPALSARLRAEFPGLAAPAPAPVPAPTPADAPPPSAGAEAIDVAALLRSTRAITGELVLDRLLRARPHRARGRRRPPLLRPAERRRRPADRRRRRRRPRAARRLAISGHVRRARSTAVAGPLRRSHPPRRRPRRRRRRPRLRRRPRIGRRALGPVRADPRPRRAARRPLPRQRPRPAHLRQRPARAAAPPRRPDRHLDRQRPPLRGPGPRPRRGRARRSAQDPLPSQHEPRAADPAQRRGRLRRADPRVGGRGRPGGDRRRHRANPAGRRAPGPHADAYPRAVARRGRRRPARARPRRRRNAGARGRGPLRARGPRARRRAHARALADGLRLPDRSRDARPLCAHPRRQRGPLHRPRPRRGPPRRDRRARPPVARAAGRRHRRRHRGRRPAAPVRRLPAARRRAHALPRRQRRQPRAGPSVRPPARRRHRSHQRPRARLDLRPARPGPAHVMPASTLLAPVMPDPSVLHPPRG
ncbi:AAA family ATPase [Nannocystis sp. bb15-2]|uniref:AAA family ATPase n=1 Tax=Nannocystis bainbridge TaxID=2995303 RepID=A0ABT5DZY6_9BACT|nr:serine/threonine-protein kinase [Nannocystis bainbridge]MDC0719149.1 AAA family ATPase [Nannocystis bainbridge]